MRNAFLESWKGFERKALGTSANLESIIADCGEWVGLVGAELIRKHARFSCVMSGVECFVWNFGPCSFG